MCFRLTCLGFGSALLLSTPAAAQSAKNVILMISDGQGFNTVQATDYYTGTTPVYEAFPVQLSMQTFSANNSVGYDPAQMWSNFNFQDWNPTDSASAATAMYAGQKIYDGQINMTTSGAPIKTFFEQYAQLGHSIGAVSSVEITHATPAAVYGHNVSRNNYAQIGTEGVYGSLPSEQNAFYDSLNYYDNLKVLMGAGHGNYDNNGNYNPAVSDKYAGGTTTFNDIIDGSAPNGWSFIESKEDFQALATGDTPDKVLGLARVNATLQQSRSNAPGAFDPMNTNVPTLSELAGAALNVLDNDPNGFAVMFEGGAVDWANHANQLDRMIEEQIDFNATVQTVVDWVEANSNWDETLLIVTADHETGSLWGDGNSGFFDVDDDGIYTPGVDFARVTDNGEGNLPGAEYFSGSHTNGLVPLYAIGAGSEEFYSKVIGYDALVSTVYGVSADFNQYIDNTSIYEVMRAAAIPEPSSIFVFGFAGVAALLGLRRRR